METLVEEKYSKDLIMIEKIFKLVQQENKELRKKEIKKTEKRQK